ncbi:MAG TPA: type IV secretion system DNA-binding domain-containing protein [Steroidobacteraceae bacterium]|jgi:hypothetical protein
MNPSAHALTHGTLGLMATFTWVLVFVIAGLVHGRSPVQRILLSPLIAIPATLIATLVLALGHAILGSAAGGEGVFTLGFGLLVCAATGYAAGRLIAASPQSTDTRYRRGAIVSDVPPPSARTSRDTQSKPGRPPNGGRSSDRRVPVTLAGIPIALEDETKHFKLIGTTGTGKSTVIREMLAAALARGDRAVIADPDGGYLRTFYDAGRGDVILNPFEHDAAKWNLLDEITNDYDVDQLARSLIPDGGESDRMWSEYARTFLISVTQRAMAADIKDDAELYHLLHVAPAKELRILLAGTSAGPFLEEGNERLFGSVRSVASSAVRALKYTTRQQGTAFSVREWVRRGNPHHTGEHTGRRGGVLFLPYKAGEIAALRSTISAWMRLAIFEAMNGGDGDQRLWFIVDELDALGEIDGLKDALARLRKFGGRCVLGFQSIAQVSSTYGKGAADTIVENCGNTLILRCSASERGGTSEFASMLIGQREILHTTHSRSRRPTEWLSSTTSTEQIRIEPAIMASEIERLPDLEGFLKLASVPDWKRVTITRATDPSVASSSRRPGSGVAPPAVPSPAAPVATAVPSREVRSQAEESRE